jgi:sensitive to high expression protein 9
MYERSVIQRSNSQREVNELLQRKSIWTDGDVGRFTTLVRQDHLYEQEEQRAKSAVDETEDAVEREFTHLMRIILARYHEEQVWSDKIRSASTYGQLTVLGLNLLVFILAIVVVEPWKRRNLAKTFENKVHELSMENAAKLDASMQEIGKQLARQEQLIQAAQDELKVTLDAMVEIERENQDKREDEAESVPGPVEDAKPMRELDFFWVGVGAGVFLATTLSGLWLGR